MTSPLPSGPFRIGIAGLGIVGAGVLRLLRDNADLIAARAGRPIVVTAVSARDRTRDRGVDLKHLRWFDDPVALATDPAIDVVVELIGGSEGPARSLVQAAAAIGRPVVTANKALLAIHGAQLAAAADAQGGTIAYEAAVAGGIPAIKTLREGLAGNRIDRVAGILNGTCNYILTTMTDSGRDQPREFADVLADAQRLGYAESDPSFDVDGIDAAHKLAILAAIAFNRPVDFAAVHIEGIRHISALDIAFARELGYRIKLLGIASRVMASRVIAGDASPVGDGIKTRVHPCMVPQSNPLAHVDGVYNAVVAEGDAVGRIMLQGRGAGAGPTASAVVADLVDLARGRTTPVWGMAEDQLAAHPAVPMSAYVGAYYLRLMVVDRAGVIADVTAALRDAGVSLESMIQRGRAPRNAIDEAVPVVLVTHDSNEADVHRALAQIEQLDAVLEKPALIRIEPA